MPIRGESSSLRVPVDTSGRPAPAAGSTQGAAMPSLELLRSLTDEHVLRAVMDHGRLTRAAIAAKTGISKPTVSESVRRLTLAGTLYDTGERTSGRGRAGSYYTLSDTAGAALVVSIRPDGVLAEAVGPFGNTMSTSTAALHRRAGLEEATGALEEAVRSVATGPVAFRTASVSAADPVDRATGRLVHLPDAPFLVGDLDPVAVLSAFVSGPILVDNDVNWAARAERDLGDGLLDNFVYLHLGEGLGCAVVADGEVVRGHKGLAGEIAHVVTSGPDGRAMPLTDVFAALDLRRPGTTAIDVEQLTSRLADHDSQVQATARTVARAVAGVVAAAIALADPGQLIVGGSWGSDPHLVTALTDVLSTAPRTIPLRAAAHTTHPDHTGARAHALSTLRTLITART